MLRLLTSLLVISLLATNHLISIDFGDRKSNGKIEYDKLDEISGLVFGNTNPDIIWAVNDGRADEIYGMDRNGNSVTILDFKKELLSKDTDIEDISTMTISGTNYIVLADIGDNDASRSSINLFFIPEPKYIGIPEINIEEESILKVEIEYIDGSQDAECLFIDPLSNNIYIVTKREKNARLYEITSDFNFSKINIAQFKAEFEFGNNTSANSTGVTGGDISKDGKHILIRDYKSVWYFSNENGNIISSLKSNPQKIDSYKYSFSKEPQGESIAWDSDISGFYTASEEKLIESFDTDLFYFRRLQSDIKKKNELVFHDGIIRNQSNNLIEYSLYNVKGQRVFNSILNPMSSINLYNLNIKAQYLKYNSKFLIINNF